MSRSLGTIIIAVLLALGVLVKVKVIPWLRRMGEPSDSPRAFLEHGRQPGTHTLVVCVGDSITHGVASANYVELLRQRFGRAGYEFVNAGISGHVAFNILQRLDAIVACHPDVITLLVGTNDVNATLSQTMEDMLHLNDRAAAVIAELIGDFLNAIRRQDVGV